MEDQEYWETIHPAKLEEEYRQWQDCNKFKPGSPEAVRDMKQHKTAAANKETVHRALIERKEAEDHRTAVRNTDPRHAGGKHG